MISTLPQWLSGSKIVREAQEEAANEMSEARKAAIAELKQIGDKLIDEMPALNAAVQAAQEKVDEANRALAVAENNRLAAIRDRESFKQPLGARQERLQALLQGELSDERIDAAIAAVDAECDALRDIADEERMSETATRLQHLIHTARPELNQLRFHEAKNLDAEIKRICK